MYTLSAKLTFMVKHATSLKDKRQVKSSILDKCKKRFNCSIAEVDTQNSIKMLTIGIALVSTDSLSARNYFDDILRFIELNIDADLVDVVFI